MIKIAVIDNLVDCKNNLIHQVDSNGPIQTVDSFEFQQEVLDSKRDDEKRVIVFNIQLKGKQGQELIRHIRDKEARVCLFLSVEENDPRGSERVLASANWILLKDNVNNSLAKEFEHVLGEGTPINPKIASRVLKFITQPEFKRWENAIILTDREIEIMTLLTRGLIYKEIAKQMGISIQTVKNHLKKIYPKLHVSNRAEATLKYLKEF